MASGGRCRSGGTRIPAVPNLLNEDMGDCDFSSDHRPSRSLLGGNGVQLANGSQLKSDSNDFSKRGPLDLGAEGPSCAHRVSGARQRSGGVEKYSSIASRQAPEHGSKASSSGPDSRICARICAAMFSAQLSRPRRGASRSPCSCNSTCEMSVRGSRSPCLDCRTISPPRGKRWRFPEPLVCEIKERFGDCLDTDHSAGSGNGMSSIVAGKQPNQGKCVDRGERAPRCRLDCGSNVRAEPHPCIVPNEAPHESKVLAHFPGPPL